MKLPTTIMSQLRFPIHHRPAQPADAMGKRPKFQRREVAPMDGVPPEGFMGKMIMSPVANYPHEGNEAERNFGAHIPTLIELIEARRI